MLKVDDYVVYKKDTCKVKEIKKMPTIEPITSGNDKMIEFEYKNLLATNDKEDLIKIIKTTYLRNKERLDNNKKIGERDEIYFKKAEEYVYNEMSIVLNMSFYDVKNYVLNRVIELKNIN